MKTEDEEAQHRIRKAKTAGEAKRMGKSVELRSDWEEIKMGLMNSLLRRKFEDPELRMKLLATGERLLVEGNWWGDTYWGVCKGKGENWLGRMLMSLRSQIQQEVLEGTSDEHREVASKAKPARNNQVRGSAKREGKDGDQGTTGGRPSSNARSYREG
jgi:hypothetical protein